jgi:anion-transporting  ArsA/GET3 family ATPase
MKPGGRKILPEGKDLIVCLGPGGVGKTSVTGALAEIAAREGKKTLAFTIDPARRLANAIGLSTAKAGEVIRTEDGFDVLMLNVRETWERVVRRYASSDGQFERIRRNRFYEYLTDNFPGFNEYIAVEKLHEIFSDADYDVIIVDTPPTSYAMSFLEAPGRVLNLLDYNIVRVFLHPGMRLGRFSLRFAAKRDFFVVRQLARFTGIDMLRELAMFIFEFEGMFKGFRDRAEAVRERLRSGGTSFLVVTSPEGRRLKEAAGTRERLVEAGYPFGGYVVNRYCWMCTGDAGCVLPSPRPSRKGFIKEAVRAGLGTGLAERLFADFDEHLLYQQRIRDEVAKMAGMGGGACLVSPAFPDDIHSLAGLRRLAGSLRRL